MIIDSMRVDFMRVALVAPNPSEMMLFTTIIGTRGITAIEI